MEDKFETRLVGDPLVSGQLIEFCSHSSNGNRKRFCFPVGKVNNFIAVYEDVTKNAGSDTHYIVHVGTNDILETKPENLMQKCFRMIEFIKSKMNNDNFVVSRILPRIGSRHIYFFQKAFTTNNRLKTICKMENVKFANFRNSFYSQTALCQVDGMYLNQAGAAHLGKHFCSVISNLKINRSSFIVKKALSKSDPRLEV